MRNSVEDYADTIRETVSLLRSHQLDYVDSAVYGVLRSIISGPGTDAEVRVWFRNALDAGDLVRAELTSAEAPAKVNSGKVT